MATDADQPVPYVASEPPLADRNAILRGFMPLIAKDLQAWMQDSSDSTVTVGVVGGTLRTAPDVPDASDPPSPGNQRGYVSLILVTRDPEDLPGARTIVDQLLESLRALEAAQSAEAPTDNSTEN